MKTALTGGIGNVLLGDDGVGPYVLRLLEAQYTFGDNVELADLGTPALDLTHRIVNRHAVILIDCVRSEEPAGTVVLYRKEDIVREAPAQRLDPHSPALSECLMAAEMLGVAPEHVLLVGIVGCPLEPQCRLSDAIQESIDTAIKAVLHELARLGFAFAEKPSPSEPDLWWTKAASSAASL